MNDYSHLSDAQLIEQFQKAHIKDVLGELYNRYNFMVMGICLKYLKSRPEAEDACMELFEELNDKLKSANVRDFKPWLGTVVRNFLNRRFKVNTKQQNLSLEEYLEKNGENFMEFSEKSTLTNEKVEVDKKEQMLHEVMNELKEEQRQCIQLFYIESKSYSEVVETTGFSFKKVKSLLQNGRRNLKLKLEERFR